MIATVRELPADRGAGSSRQPRGAGGIVWQNEARDPQSSGRHAGGDLVLRDGGPRAGRVAGGHRVERRVARRIVLFRVEEEDCESAIGSGIVEDEELRRRYS